jgi:hypothetical protein
MFSYSVTVVNIILENNLWYFNGTSINWIPSFGPKCIFSYIFVSNIYCYIIVYYLVVFLKKATKHFITFYT